MAARARAFEAVITEALCGKLNEPRPDWKQPPGFADALERCRADKHMPACRSMTVAGSATAAALGAADDDEPGLDTVTSRSVVRILMESSPSCQAAFMNRSAGADHRTSVDVMPTFLDWLTSLGERQYGRKMYDFLGMTGKRRVMTALTDLGVMNLSKRSCYWGELADSFIFQGIETTGWDDGFTGRLESSLSSAERKRRQIAKNVAMNESGQDLAEKKAARRTQYDTLQRGSTVKLTAWHRDACKQDSHSIEFTLAESDKQFGSYSNRLFGPLWPHTGRAKIELTEEGYALLTPRLTLTSVLCDAAMDVIGSDKDAEAPSYANCHPATLHGRVNLAASLRAYFTGKRGCCHYLWVELSVKPPGGDWIEL
jgi:hypothetical protein